MTTVVSLVDRPRGLLRRYAWRFSRKKMAGEIADPVRALAPHGGVLTASGVLEMAAWVALENYRSRVNAGLGLRSQGFAASCTVPAASGAVGHG
jgi:hypothetical protein